MEENFKTWEYNPLPRKKKYHKKSDFWRKFDRNSRIVLNTLTNLLK
jgi:hypothetical protein